jgi:hypothetical protein
MRLFLRLSFLLFIALVVLSGLSLAIGYTQPAPDFIPGLERCGGKACFLGMIPGQTTWDTAQTIMQAKIPFPNVQMVIRRYEADRLVLVERDINNKALLGGIQISLYTNRVTAGAVVARYHAPCAVAFYPNGNTALTYPDLDFFLADSTLDPTTPIAVLWLGADPMACQNAGVAWVGFAAGNPNYTPLLPSP